MQRKYFEAERLLLLFLMLFFNIWMIIANFFEFPTGIKFSGFYLTIILIGVFYFTKIKFSEKLNNNFLTRYYEYHPIFWGCLIYGTFNLYNYFLGKKLFALIFLFIGIVGPFIYESLKKLIGTR